MYSINSTVAVRQYIDYPAPGSPGISVLPVTTHDGEVTRDKRGIQHVRMHADIDQLSP